MLRTKWSVSQLVFVKNKRLSSNMMTSSAKCLFRKGHFKSHHKFCLIIFPSLVLFTYHHKWACYTPNLIVFSRYRNFKKRKNCSFYIPYSHIFHNYLCYDKDDLILNILFVKFWEREWSLRMYSIKCQLWLSIIILFMPTLPTRFLV